MPNVAVITTVRHNVGDDFVREGVAHVLQRALPGMSLSYELIHKHAPASVRHGLEGIRRTRVSSWVDAALPLWATSDRVLKADLVIQSGAPVYWCHDGITHCADNEWYGPLVKRRLSGRDIPFLNLGAGTCQRYHSDGSEFIACEKDTRYARDLYARSLVTTLRDKLAKTIFERLGLEAPVIPCPSIFARDSLGIEPRKPEYVVLNYMHAGGHYTFGQDIDPQRWEREFRRFYAGLKQSERCILACHNPAELEEARRLDPGAELFYSEDYGEYLRLYAGAKWGVVNRVHAAFGIASFGRPAFCIGTDSRARMVEELGLRSTFVTEASADSLSSEVDELIRLAPAYSEQMLTVRAKAMSDYLRALQPLADRLHLDSDSRRARIA